MRLLRAELSALIPADAAKVYGIIADYRDGHAQIIPPEVFHGLTVISGGYGAGTVLSVRALLFGRERLLRMTVAEPEPGRVLTETDMDTGMCTSFTVDSIDSSSCTVTIATTWMSLAGFAGVMESWLVPRSLRSIYRRELGRLARLASTSGSTGA